MELNIISPTETTALVPVQWNYEELKAEISQKVQVYKAIVYGEDQIKDAKSDRANLNKLDKALTAAKISIKKKYLEPYEEFENQIKELTGLIKDASGHIDSQVKGFEDKRRQEKLAAAEAIFRELTEAVHLDEFITWDKVQEPRWGNSSTSEAVIREEISTLLKSVQDGIDAISELKTDFGWEILDHYRSTLDLGEAIREGQRLEAQAKAKAEYEARNQTPAAVEAPKQPEVVAVEAEQLYTVRFQVSGTRAELMALSAFLKSNHINYTQI